MNSIDHIKYPVTYSELGTYINDAEGKMIADVRGWGWIQHLADDNDDSLNDLTKLETIQDDIGKFIAEAINEKLKGRK